MYLPHVQLHTNVTSVRSVALLTLSVCFDSPPSLSWQAGALRVTQQAQCKLIHTHQKSCLPQGPELFQQLSLAGLNSTKLLLCTPSIIVCSSNYIITQLMSLHHLTNPWQNCRLYLIISIAHPHKLQLLLPPQKQKMKMLNGENVQFDLMSKQLMYLCVWKSPPSQDHLTFRCKIIDSTSFIRNLDMMWGMTWYSECGFVIWPPLVAPHAIVWPFSPQFYLRLLYCPLTYF